MKGEKDVRSGLKPTLLLVMFLIAIGLLVMVDILQWQAFQEVTDSDVSYFTWKLLINPKGK